jgi:hypothetical protein
MRSFIRYSNPVKSVVIQVVVIFVVLVPRNIINTVIRFLQLALHKHCFKIVLLYDFYNILTLRTIVLVSIR